MVSRARFDLEEERNRSHAPCECGSAATRRDVFFSPAYPVARCHVCQSVKTKKPGAGAQERAAESCVERERFQRPLEDALGKRSGTRAFKHNVPFRHLTVRSSAKPQRVECEFLPHHHLYLAAPSRRTSPPNFNLISRFSETRSA